MSDVAIVALVALIVVGAIVAIVFGRAFTGRVNGSGASVNVSPANRQAMSKGRDESPRKRAG